MFWLTVALLNLSCITVLIIANNHCYQSLAYVCQALMDQQSKQDAEDKLQIIEENEILQREIEKLKQDLVL